MSFPWDMGQGIPVGPARQPVGRPAATPQPGPLAPLSQGALQRMADARVKATLAALSSPVERARQRAVQTNLANQQALQGIGLASADLMKGIGPGIQQGYQQGAESIGKLAGGFSAATADRVRAAQQAAAEAVQQQTPGAATPQGADPAALQDVLYGLEGFIPAQSLVEQGAEGNRWGQALPAINAFQTKEQVAAEMARGATEDDEYENQLIDIAARQPELRTQVLDELYARETEKLNSRLRQQELGLSREGLKLDQKRLKNDRADAAERKREFNVTEANRKKEAAAERTQHATDRAVSHSEFLKTYGLDERKYNDGLKQWAAEHNLNLRDASIRERAQTLYEKQFGHTVTQDQEEIKLERERLQLTRQELGIRNKEAQDEIIKAMNEGAEIDASASRVVGWVIDKNRQYVLDENGKRIKVNTGARPKDVQEVYKSAVKEARVIRGEPAENQDIGPISPGRYLAKEGARGSDVFSGRAGFPSTTNNIAKASYDTAYTFVEAQSYLMSTYGLPRARARAALISAGWKPDGKRTASGPPAPGRTTVPVMTP